MNNKTHKEHQDEITHEHNKTAQITTNKKTYKTIK